MLRKEKLMAEVYALNAEIRPPHVPSLDLLNLRPNMSTSRIPSLINLPSTMLDSRRRSENLKCVNQLKLLLRSLASAKKSREMLSFTITKGSPKSNEISF